MAYAAPKEKVKSKKELEREQLDIEQEELLTGKYKKLQALIANQNESLKEEQEGRKQLKEEYYKEAKVRKYQYKMQERLNTSGN